MLPGLRLTVDIFGAEALVKRLDLPVICVD